jgi:ABC-type multidrug transport system fused ATPase/permease subunit
MKTANVIYTLVKPYRGIYVVLFLATMAITFFYLFIPAQIGHFIEALHPVAHGAQGGVAMRSIVIVAALLTGVGAASLVRGMLIATTCERVVNDLRARFFAHMLDMPLDESLRKPLGAVASEFSSDLAIIQEGISSKLLDFTRNVLFTIGALSALLYVDAKMTAFAVLAISTIVGVVLLFMRAVTATLLLVQQERSKLVSVLIESVSNVYVIQAYGRKDFMQRRFGAQIDATFKCIKRYAWLTSLMNPVSLVIFSSVLVGAAAYGIHEINSNHLQPSSLIAYFTYSLMLIASVSQISVLGGQLQQAAALLHKHAYLLVPRPSANCSSAPMARPSVVGGVSVSVCEMSYRYFGSSQNALSNISFEIPSGGITAIVGESGSGKTTLLGVIMGLLRHQSGTVRIAESNDLLRGNQAGYNIAIVPQEPFLFSGTVVENIVFGRDGISATEVQRAARSARIHDEIIRMTAGYDSVLDESGRNLSRGQRQRIAIARALVGKPSLLILDEATASLDQSSETVIRGAIEELRGKMTILISAHRGELLKLADMTVEIELGKVKNITATSRTITGSFSPAQYELDSKQREVAII